MSDPDNKTLYCSFCAKNAMEVKKLIAGPNVFICDQCVTLCTGILKGEKSAELPAPDEAAESLPSPRVIKDFLDQYVIGQDDAKMTVAVAVYNHYKRINHPVIDDVEIEKSNLLMIGPTGSGKTLIGQTIARLLDVPFAIADANGLTEAGYVGDDVESIITRLMQAAGYDPRKAECGIVFIDEIDKKRGKADQAAGGSGGRDVSGEGVQQALLKLIEGTEVMIPPQGGRKGQSELIKVDTRNILFMVGGAFVGLDKVIERETGQGSAGIGFLAPIGGPAQSVNALLRRIEPDHLVKYGMIPELIGRLPIITALEELDGPQLVRVLTEPKNALVKQFVKMFALDGVELVFEPDALAAVATTAKQRRTGARGLRSVIEHHLVRLQFTLPELREQGARRILITRAVIEGTDVPTIDYGPRDRDL